MPHRTKIRTSIVEAWALWFEGFKKTLAVSNTMCSQMFPSIFERLFLVAVVRKSELHHGYLVFKKPGVLLVHYSALYHSRRFE